MGRTGKRSRHSRAAPAHDAADAHWLNAPDAIALAASSLAPPWQGARCSGEARLAQWNRIGETDQWTHNITWLPYGGGLVGVHRFVPISRVSMHNEVSKLAEFAARAMDTGDADMVSNVGGYQSDRELFLSSPEVRRNLVASLISDAVHSTAIAEADFLGRCPIMTEPCEAWFNVLDANGAWNALHTHTGSAYSGVIYLAEGARVEGATAESSSCSEFTYSKSHRAACTQLEEDVDICCRFPGRLAFFVNVNGPDWAEHVTIASEELQAQHILPLQSLSSSQVPSNEALEQTNYGCLTIEPVAGTCVIFPSFLPHSVIPTRTSPSSASQSIDGIGSLRVSMAFNFGLCEPVLVQLLVHPEDDTNFRNTSAKVRLIIEVADGLCGMRQQGVGA
eukprot:scaffold47752_cov39-Tisochrysis_lutea.AAC.1